jgi:23S rRNA (adenine-N6)-dimethyltransferase
MPRSTPSRRRALSQNFLHDPRYVAEIIGTLHPPPGALVVDLGAGAGALTREVARHARVIAVELDPTWTRELRTRAPAWGDVTVVGADALTFAFPRERFYVVSNAPYGIGTQLVRRVLTDAHGLAKAVIVLQREAAHRLAARGRFAASWAPWFELRVVSRIPARAFRPVPSVESAVLTIVPRTVPLLSPAAFAQYDAFLARAFTGRGNTLAQRLNMRPGALGIARDATPATIAPDDYARLFGVVCRASTSQPGRGRS